MGLRRAYRLGLCHFCAEGVIATPNKDEFVSRDVFEERSKNFTRLFETNNKNIEKLTDMINNLENVIIRLVTLEEECAKQRKASDASMVEIAKTLSEISMTVKDHSGRLENHAKRIYEMEHKPAKKFEAIITSLTTGILMLIAGAIFGFLVNR